MKRCAGCRVQPGTVRATSKMVSGVVYPDTEHSKECPWFWSSRAKVVGSICQGCVTKYIKGKVLVQPSTHWCATCYRGSRDSIEQLQLRALQKNIVGNGVAVNMGV